eukprot:1147087-Pelagomonas_calceolata.AAC.3
MSAEICPHQQQDQPTASLAIGCRTLSAPATRSVLQDPLTLLTTVQRWRTRCRHRSPPAHSRLRLTSF